MSKVKTQYQCSNCGSISIKWQGKCSNCGKYNTMEEQTVQPDNSSLIKNRLAQNSFGGYSNLNNSLSLLSNVKDNEFETSITGIESLDNLFSSQKGLIKGSINLLSGDPGIGKSTLLLQLAGIFAQQKNSTGELKKVIYVSAEESAGQIAQRGRRLGVPLDKIYILNSAELESIINIITNPEHKPDLLIVDSIQSIYSVQLQSTPGSVSQVKECASVIARHTKANHIDTFIIGQVTKDGDVAGPQVLEHIVDSVLFFEGANGDKSEYKILRAHKNRYGSTHEIALFKMDESGLNEVTDPSSIFLENQDHESFVGTAFLATQYKNQAMMIEIQSLVDSNNGSSQYPKRIANGVEYNRLSILIALLNKHYSVSLFKYDIFLNVAAGIKIADTASDIAVILSVLSSILNKPIKSKTAMFGEVNLNGNLRLTKHYEQRIAVAHQIGFENIILPFIKDEKMVKSLKKKYPNINLIMCKDIGDAVQFVFPE